MRVLDVEPSRVLAVYAHPDDAEVSCGGALGRWASAGAEVHVIVVARGEKGSRDPSVDPDELASARTEETKAAGAVLGIAEHHWLGRADGEVVDDTSLRSDIVRIIRAVRPDVVVAPDPTAVFFGEHYVNHPDHRAVGWAALAAVSHASGNPHYHPECGAAWTATTFLLSGTLQPDAWIDITATLEKKVEALACHRSQLGEAGEWLRNVVVQRTLEAGRAAGVTHAESFRQLEVRCLTTSQAVSPPQSVR
ncbi:MAG TPA: PIG-L deacetylase family protein [Acidimicrobiales bacterium]|nr:PIG-L deacetylase family protein [Acidimicrobiales bacterium]